MISLILLIEYCKVYNRAVEMSKNGAQLINSTLGIQEMDGTKVMGIMVQGKQDAYIVNISWNILAPRVPSKKEWFKKIRFSCSCDSYKYHNEGQYLCKGGLHSISCIIHWKGYAWVSGVFS